jgi:serine/threonine-protein kinase
MVRPVGGAVDDEILGKTLGGRFRVQRALTEWGRADAFAAIDSKDGREVAVLALRGAFDGGVIERVQRAAGVRAPGLAEVIDASAGDGVLYVAIEMPAGPSLRHPMNAASPPATAHAIARELLTALAAAHAAGIVHRHLTPDSVLLGSGGPQIIDLPMPKAVDAANLAQLLQAGMVNAAGYIPPERAAGGVAVPRSDLYCVGVIWWEMLAGRALFSAPTAAALVDKHANAFPPALKSAGAAVEPQIEQLINELLEKDPVLRPDAQDVVRRLDAIAPAAARTYAAVPTHATTSPSFTPPQPAPASLAHAPPPPPAQLSPPPPVVQPPPLPPLQPSSNAPPTTTPPTPAPPTPAPLTAPAPVSPTPPAPAAMAPPPPQAAPPPPAAVPLRATAAPSTSMSGPAKKKSSGCLVVGCLSVAVVVAVLLGLAALGIWGAHKPAARPAPPVATPAPARPAPAPPVRPPPPPPRAVAPPPRPAHPKTPPRTSTVDARERAKEKAKERAREKARERRHR